MITPATIGQQQQVFQQPINRQTFNPQISANPSAFPQPPSALSAFGQQQALQQPITGQTANQDPRQAVSPQLSAIPSAFPQPPTAFAGTNIPAPGLNTGMLPANAAGQLGSNDLYNPQAGRLGATSYPANTDPGYDPRPRVRYRAQNGYAAAQQGAQQRAQGQIQPAQPRRQAAIVPQFQQQQPQMPTQLLPGNVPGPSREIAEAQEMLVRLGMQPGPVDGIMKPETAQAVRTYASIIGLQSDGTITPSLLNRLRQDAGQYGGGGSVAPTRGSGPALYNPVPAQPIGAQPISYQTDPQTNLLQPTFAAPPRSQVNTGPGNVSRLTSPAVVGEIQQALATLGFNAGPVDGIMNAGTARAISEYQGRRGLAADGGISGPLLAHLRADAAPNALKRTGPLKTIGTGQVSTYVEMRADGIPVSVGILIETEALTALTQQTSDQRRCIDLNGNGYPDRNAECMTVTEHFLRMPTPANAGSNQSAATPISWVSLNWLPQGHRRITPTATANWPAALAQPHLSVHFFLQDFEAVQAIAHGPCGDMIDCTLLARATMPVPAQFIPAGYVNVGGAISYMGNHLLDSHAPEFAATNPANFANGFTFGSYDGALTFFEPKVTLAALTTTANACFPISQPASFAKAGLYPTAYCVRQRPEMEGATISLEGLIFQPAAQQITSR